MIHYDLRCSGGHGFDGWFRSSVAFDTQARSGLLDCPVCGTQEVSRAMMAPRLSRGAAAPPAPAAPSPEPPAQSTAVNTLPPMPDQLRAALQRIRAEIEQKCDYVGPGFAKAAREMHEGAAPPRPIYGETTPAEAEALAEDGIDVARIPWVPRADG